MKKIITKCILLFSILTLVMVSCKKSPEFVNPVYVCECGSMAWQGDVFELLDANYIQPDTANFLSRRYYITAEVNLEGETQAHSVNMMLEVDSVDKESFFVEDDPDLLALIEEINFNDPLDTLVQYVPIAGGIEINPAILGGTEVVSFDFILKRWQNGTLVGFNVPFSGSFKVQVLF